MQLQILPVNPGYEVFDVRCVVVTDDDVLQHVGTLNLRVTPRKLPPFASTEALESYATCNSLHRSIAAHHARQGDRGDAIRLGDKSAEQLERYWATLTQ